MRPKLLAILIAASVALPFVLLADYAWMTAESSPAQHPADNYVVGDQIFNLGWPLTRVILGPALHGHYLTPNDHWWAIPSLDLLFLLQWIVWGQLVVWIIFLLKSRSRKLRRG
jgi:hypothetical protein